MKKLKYDLDLQSSSICSFERNIKDLNAKILSKDNLLMKLKKENDFMLNKYEEYNKKLEQESKKMRKDLEEK